MRTAAVGFELRSIYDDESYKNVLATMKAKLQQLRAEYRARY